MNAYLLSLNPKANIADQWDYGFLKDFLEGNMWQPPGWTGFDIQETDFIPTEDRAIVVLPARHHAHLINEINDEIGQLKHCVLFLMGDEEADFPVEELKHKSQHVWIQNPHPGRHDSYNKLGTGYPPQLKKLLKQHPKDLNVFFSGQVTHKRRHELVENLNEYELNDKNCMVNPTGGFTSGLEPENYYRYMSRAKIAPAPSGAVIPDSFRAFEALESMAIPIADEVNPTNTITTYWNWLFGEETPFPKIVGYDRLVGLIQEELELWPINMHRQTAWWVAKKRAFVYQVMEQLNG